MLGRGRIEHIRECTVASEGRYSHDYEGYEVKTSDHIFQVLIDNESSCCEDFGYAITEDNPEVFVGANLLKVELTDTENSKFEATGDVPTDFDCGGVQFVDFVTDIGVFQVAVFNDHNGYYGHDIKFVVDSEEIHTDVL